jgi:alpha-L-fucosidase 2
VDGSFGVSAAVAEMILQSHEDEIFLLPALPKFWENGKVRGLCARGGFEVDIKWEKNRLISALILSRKGNKCRLRTSHAVDVFSNGEKIEVKRYEKSLIEFDTKKDEIYKIAIFIQGAEL